MRAYASTVKYKSWFVFRGKEKERMYTRIKINAGVVQKRNESLNKNREKWRLTRVQREKLRKA